MRWDNIRGTCPIIQDFTAGYGESLHTWDGCEILHARPTNALFRSMIASLSMICTPSGTAVGGPCGISRGTTRVSSSGGLECIAVSCSFASSRTSSPAFSALSRSSYQGTHRSKTFCSPSNTHTVSSVHSTPLTDMNVLRIDPKRAESTPKGPMYLDNNCS